MTTPERSIEEIVEEFNSTFHGCDQCQYGNGQGDWIEHWLTQTLQAERQRCEEMVGQIRLLIAKYAKEDDMDVLGLVNGINALCK